MKKNVKRLLTVMLAVALIGGMTGCGGQKASDKPVLKVAMECASAPFNWTQNDDSNGAVPITDSNDFAGGYDVMMAKYLAEQMGYDVEVYKTDWESIPVAVQSGKVDCAIASQSITAERLETVDFTEPYFYADVVALTMKDSPYGDAKTIEDLSGATGTAQINTVFYSIIDQIPNLNKLPAMESAPNAIVSLTSGKVDVIVIDLPIAMAAQATNPALSICDVGFDVSDEDVNLGISVKKGNKELLDKLNAGLATLTIEDYEKMMAEAISVQPASLG